MKISILYFDKSKKYIKQRRGCMFCTLSSVIKKTSPKIGYNALLGWQLKYYCFFMGCIIVEVLSFFAF